MSVSIAIKVKRKEKGFSQAQLAYMIGCSDKTVRRWESGERVPDANDLNKLANILDTSVAYLMGETEELRPSSVKNTARTTTKLSNERDFNVGQRQRTYPQPPTLEDFARVREASRSLDFFDNSDLNAAEEMLLASLNAVRSAKNIRTAQQDGIAKSA